MQLLPILLIAVVLAADGGLTLDIAPQLSPGWRGLGCTVPVALLLLGQWLVTWQCRRWLDRGTGPGPIIAAERAAMITRLSLLAHHGVSVLVLGWLALVREKTGDLVLVDELLVVALPLAGIFATWWIYYPIERRVRDALLIRRLDDGSSLHPMPARGRYVWRQGQVQIMILLVPVLLIVGLSETIQLLVDWLFEGPRAEAIAQGGTLLAGVTVFIFAPLIARGLLTTEPMGAGPLRESLMGICTRHRVKVKRILIWRTDGMMINAAVMGLIAPLRFVLITDALLESMHQSELEAVMAHEVGHIRRHHMPWMIACLIAILAGAEFVVVMPLRMLLPEEYFVSSSSAAWLELAVGATIIVLALLAFGWVSRRFERQADTFAVQHLSEGHEDPDHEPVVTEPAVAALRGALHSISRLNAIELDRKSWRHGSIAWRVSYLESILGQPLRTLPIDRVIRWLKVLAAIGVIGAIGYETYRQVTYDDPPAPADSAIVVDSTATPDEPGLLARDRP